LPCFPSLRTRTDSCDFPATAALERFILKQRSSPVTTLEDHPDLSPTSEDRCDDELTSHAWPKFELDDFPQQARRVSVGRRKSSSHSVSDSFHHGASSSACEPTNTLSSKFTFPSSPASYELEPKQPVPSVSQITEALAKL
jgi:hypothetical protein